MHGRDVLDSRVLVHKSVVCFFFMRLFIQRVHQQMLVGLHVRRSFSCWSWWSLNDVRVVNSWFLVGMGGKVGAKTELRWWWRCSYEVTISLPRCPHPFCASAAGKYSVTETETRGKNHKLRHRRKRNCIKHQNKKVKGLSLVSNWTEAGKALPCHTYHLYCSSYCPCL